MLGIEQSNGNVILPNGNALKYLREYFTEDTQPTNPYLIDPKDIKTISFGANGDVLNSNINDNLILEIIKNYQPNI